jgi:hypothetical protein
MSVTKLEIFFTSINTGVLKVCIANTKIDAGTKVGAIALKQVSLCFLFSPANYHSVLIRQDSRGVRLAHVAVHPPMGSNIDMTLGSIRYVGYAYT